MDAQPFKPDSTAPARPALVRPWIWALLAAVLTLATYLPALAGEFVWDDTQLIEQTPQSRANRPIIEYFTRPFWEPNSIAPEMGLYYRPLVALSYDLDHRVHGLNSAGYRITNYVFHVVNVVLLFALLRRFGAGGLSAALLSATWGVLPRLSECVAWISGRTDVFATTFVLAALLLRSTAWPGLVLGSISILLGLFSKETAAAGIVALACLELTEPKRSWLSRVSRLVVLLVPAIIWLLLKSRVSGILPSGADYQPTRIRLLMSLEAIGRYTTMVLDWLRPSAEIGSMGKPQLAFVIVGSGVLLGTLVALTLLWRGMTWLQRALLAGVFAALLPVLHFVQLTIAVNAADRFLYIPLALLTLLAGTSKRFGRTWRPLVAVLIVLVTSIPATLARAKAWADPVDLWSSEYTQSGGTCETCRIELAKLQAEAGDFIPALRMQNSLMRDTARTGGVPGLVAMNSAILYLRIGEYERARAILDRLVQDAPGVPRFWRELATVQAATGHYEEAERSAQRALDLMPSYDNARAAIGLIRTLPKRAAQLNLPDLSDAQRADTLTAAGRTLEAERLWLQVLQTSSNLAELEGALDFLVNLGSSRAVTHVLTTQPRLLQNSPELAAKLRLKDELHRKLAPLESSARKPR